MKSLKSRITLTSLALLSLLLLYIPVTGAQTAPRAIASWSAITNYADGTLIPTGTVVTYNLYRGLLADGSDQAAIKTGIAATTYTDTTVTATTVYYFSVSGTANSVEGARSAVVKFTFASVTPGVPPNVTVH